MNKVFVYFIASLQINYLHQPLNLVRGLRLCQIIILLVPDEARYLAHGLMCSFWNLNFHILVITDIDECVSDTHDCLKDLADCSNTLGSYACACKHGYYGDGKTSCLPLPAGGFNFDTFAPNHKILVIIAIK